MNAEIEKMVERLLNQYASQLRPLSVDSARAREIRGRMEVLAAELRRLTEGK